ncbi:unnamed protein product [Anisakis simplex]|uniref:Sushi, von Willebrand factor type A, EGF and pentraxin domain-containing protein 1 n=1 Tax=Anisakis simplex TaxID=6269 RepID=A0A0M3JZK9_ANISI|nr:unnamed protein product [Anisakis simplex]
MSRINYTDGINGQTPSPGCPKISVQDGLVVYDIFSERHVGTHALILCSLGFSSKGATNIRCGSDSRWETTPGECVGPAKCPELTINNGIVYYDLLLPRVKGTSAFLKCDDDTVPTQPSFIVCGNNGEWNQQIGSCKSNNAVTGTPLVKCPLMNKVKNGYIFYGVLQQRQVNSKAHLICALGYIPSGALMATCHTGGYWSGPLGECKALISG